MVVEITPIGISTLRWKFYIIWVVLNGAFVPFTYLLYPETAGRTLEDIDEYFRGQPKLLVFRDKVRRSSNPLPLKPTEKTDSAKIATQSTRPEVFIQKEETEVRRRSTVDERAMSLAQQHRRYSQMAQTYPGAGASPDLEKSGIGHDEKMG